MGGFMGSLSAKSAYMLMYVRESHATSVFDKSGLSSLVSNEVQAAVRDDLPASLPQAFTIALPHGRGVMSKAGEGEGGGGGGEGEGGGEGREESSRIIGGCDGAGRRERYGQGFVEAVDRAVRGEWAAVESTHS